MKPLTAPLEQIIASAERIQQNRYSGDPTYMPTVMVLANLPHSDPKEQVWQRKNGGITLTVASKVYIDDKTGETKFVGVPYGVYPRLVLYWLTREVKLKKSRRLELGNSLSEFMEALGLIPSGGPQGSIPMLKKQMKRLFASRITFEVEKSHKHLKAVASRDMLVAEDSFLMWDTSDPAQPTLLSNWIEISEKFYNAILGSVVPLDVEGIRAVRDSALGLDLYAWLNYEIYRASQNGKERRVPWRALEKQLGCNYTRHRKFKEKAREQLKTIQAVYFDWRIDDDGEGLTIHPGTPAISGKASKLL